MRLSRSVDYGDGVEDFFFFFFKQKTAYEIDVCDWSSDVLFRSKNWT